MYIVITGGGKVGEYLATILLQSGHTVSIIEQDPQTALDLSVELKGKYLVIEGDGSDSVFQNDAGIRRADVFVATTGLDENNLVACEIASNINGVKRCVARVNSPKNLRIFRELGIECISSTEMIANLIEEEATDDQAAVGSQGVLVSLKARGVDVFEVNMNYTRRNKSCGIRVEDVEMPEGCAIVAVAMPDASLKVAVPKTELLPGARLIVMAESDMVNQAKAVIRSL